MTQMLIKQGNVDPKLISSLQQFYGRCHELVDCYGISISRTEIDLFPFT